MRNLFLAIFLVFISIQLFAQSKTYLYYFNAAFEPASKENAVYYGRGFKADSIFILMYYTVQDNQLIANEQYKDSTLSILHGKATSYHLNKRIKTIENFSNNELIRYVNYDSLGRRLDSNIYDQKKLLFSSGKRYFGNNQIKNTYEKDNVHHTIKDIVYDSLGNKIDEVLFAENKGVYNEYDQKGNLSKTSILKDTLSTEAEFPGGTAGWRKFLSGNLNTQSLQRTNNIPPGVYTSIVSFKVEKDGTLSNIKTQTKLGYNIDEEAIRVIRRSPKWIPARTNGRPVPAYRTQPIMFKIEGNTGANPSFPPSGF